MCVGAWPMSQDAEPLCIPEPIAKHIPRRTSRPSRLGRWPVLIFTNIIKPTHLCNLACTYCYNEDVRRPIMSAAVGDRVVSQTFAHVQGHLSDRSVNFVWHGGEPLIAGLEFYRAIVRSQSNYARGTAYGNAIQTNGLLITDAWIEFFLAERFAVSLSLDGPRDIHDAYRVSRSGRGSFDQVVETIEKMQASGLNPGVCLVVSKAMLGRAADVWDIMTHYKLGFNVIPMLNSGTARGCTSDLGVDPEEFAEFWTDLYDRWFFASESKYAYGSDFVFKTRAILAGQPFECTGLDQCFETNVSVDPIGDVYPCASLSGIPRHRYGNLLEHDLTELLATPTAVDHRHRRRDPICSQCEWEPVCHGGCPSRSDGFYGDFHHRDYYCPGLKTMFAHIRRRLVEFHGGTGSRELSSGHPKVEGTNATASVASRVALPVMAPASQRVMNQCGGCSSNSFVQPVRLRKKEELAHGNV